MKNLREQAERLHRIMKEPISGTPEEMDLYRIAEIESVLKEVVVEHLNEAAILVEETHKFCEPPMCEIANKIRALMVGG